MTQDTEISDMFDHLCWYLCSSRERFVPPEETSARSLEGMDDDASEEFWHGYHSGSLAHLDGVADFIEMYDIDVEARARAYVDESDSDLEPPKTREELKAVMNDE